MVGGKPTNASNTSTALIYSKHSWVMEKLVSLVIIPLASSFKPEMVLMFFSDALGRFLIKNFILGFLGFFFHSLVELE